MKRWILWIEAVCLMFALFSGSVVLDTQAATPTQQQSQIDDLKRQEEEVAEKISDLEDQISQHNDQLEEMVQQKNLIDQQIALLQEQIAINNEQIRVYRLEIAKKQIELDEAEVKREQLHEKNKERIRAMEESGKFSYWSVLFRANSFSELLDQLTLMQEIAQSDSKRLAQLREIEIEISQTKEDLVAQQEALEATQQQLLESESELLQKREAADKVLQEMIAKGVEFDQLLEESEKKQAELMEQLAKEEAKNEESKDQEKNDDPNPPQTGTWLVPVPYYTLTSPFGMRYHPILGVYRMHQGVDMACAQDTPIYASRSGVVTTAAYQEDGAGNYVQIDHGDGYKSIYMHMTRYIVSPGQTVSAGEVIGYVGSTGLSKGNHLHFGISYNGTYVNPMEYLP